MADSTLIQRAQALAEARAATIDGHPRPAAQEAEINAATYRILQTGDGKIFFDWLRQITVNKVLGANSTDAELRTQEGMRLVTALIEARNTAEHSRLLNAKVNP